MFIDENYNNKDTLAIEQAPKELVNAFMKMFVFVSCFIFV